MILQLELQYPLVLLLQLLVECDILKQLFVVIVCFQFILLSEHILQQLVHNIKFTSILSDFVLPVKPHHLVAAEQDTQKFFFLFIINRALIPCRKL